MSFIRSIVALAAAVAAVPASAVTYDAFTSFDGVNYPAGVFAYGYGHADATGAGFFSSSTGCGVTAPSCLHDATLGAWPQATKGNPGRQGTINVPADALVLHPGQYTGVFIGFVAPTAGYYRVTSSLSLIDDTPSGVGVTAFSNIGGVVSLGDRFVLDTASPSATPNGSIFLNTADVIGLIIDPDGTDETSYYFDSVAVNLTASVPEPASWGMMLLGFGLMGVGLRSRRRAMLAA